MDRREFFRRGLGKVTKEVVKHADAKVSARASRWIRPPFAIDEIEFLLACTRCDDCIKACPYNIIFPLATKNGADVMNTPALDLLNNGCHLCEDWPCVNACEVNALAFPQAVTDEPGIADNQQLDLLAALKLAIISINTGHCLPYQGPECGACAASCPVEGALQWQMERPSINMDVCTGCALCREACIVEPKAIVINKNPAT